MAFTFSYLSWVGGHDLVAGTLRVSCIFTGRNEVMAKVLFYTCLSFILFTGGEGVCLSACWDTTPPGPGRPPPRPGRPPRTRQTTPPGRGRPPPRDEADYPRTRQTPPGANFTIRSTSGGTHPTGMHSCFERGATWQPDEVVLQNKYLGDRRNVVCDSFSYVGGGPNISNYHFLSFSFEARVNTISFKVYITVLLVQPKIVENKNDLVHWQCLN